MAPTSISQQLARLMDAAAEVYAAPGDPPSLAIANSLRATEAPIAPLVGAQPPALKDLTLAMEAIPPGPLAEAIRDCAARLPWTDRVFVKPSKLACPYAFVEIAGPTGFARRDDLRFGLYLQSPGTFYSAHSHEAEERYHVVSGTAKWQKDDGDYLAMAPGTSIHHAPWQRHAMETGREALLALWVWTGNLDPGTYRIDG
jgi:mannose-6-phosphate isomerase-like protein (cupin superfamily)